MFRDKLVAGDVNEQILLLEVLADAAGQGTEEADGGGRDGGLGDEDARVEVVLVDEVVEGAHLLGADAAGVRAELDVDGTAVGLGRRVRFAREGGVFGGHGFCGTGLDLHLVATVGDLRLVCVCMDCGCRVGVVVGRRREKRSAYSG